MSAVVAYAPCNNREEEVKNAFQRERERIIEDVDPGKKLRVMGGLNGWLEGRVTGVFGVPDANEHDEKNKWIVYIARHESCKCII